MRQIVELWPLLILVLLVVVWMKARRRGSVSSRPRLRGTVGPGAAGAIYDMLNQDKRNAIELIVEERAAERTQEHEDDIVDEPPAADYPKVTR